MKRLFVPLLAAVLLLARDHRGVQPRSSGADYPAHGSADGVTIGAVLLPTATVRNQLGREMVKAGYTVLEIAVYPGPGKTVDLSSYDFAMIIGSNPDVVHAERPAVVAASIEADKHTNQPRIPGRVQVYGEQTIGVSSGGRDPATGRRYRIKPDALESSLHRWGGILYARGGQGTGEAKRQMNTSDICA